MEGIKQNIRRTGPRWFVSTSRNVLHLWGESFISTFFLDDFFFFSVSKFCLSFCLWIIIIIVSILNSNLSGIYFCLYFNRFYFVDLKLREKKSSRYVNFSSIIIWFLFLLRPLSKILTIIYNFLNIIIVPISVEIWMQFYSDYIFLDYSIF